MRSSYLHKRSQHNIASAARRSGRANRRSKGYKRRPRASAAIAHANQLVKKSKAKRRSRRRRR